MHVAQHCASETTDTVGTMGGTTAEPSSQSLALLSDNRRRLSHPVSTERFFFSFHTGDGEIEPRSHHSAIPILLLASNLMQRADNTDKFSETQPTSTEQIRIRQLERLPLVLI